MRECVVRGIFNGSVEEGRPHHACHACDACATRVNIVAPLFLQPGQLGESGQCSNRQLVSTSMFAVYSDVQRGINKSCGRIGREICSIFLRIGWRTKPRPSCSCLAFATCTVVGPLPLQPGLLLVADVFFTNFLLISSVIRSCSQFFFLLLPS